MREVVGGVVTAMLATEGVDTTFGIVDGTYLGLFASFEKYDISLVSPRHETTAAHMAGAYARSTGRLGVCMASNGPERREYPAGGRGGERRGQPGAAHHEQPASGTLLPRSGRYLPVL